MTDADLRAHPNPGVPGGSVAPAPPDHGAAPPEGGGGAAVPEPGTILLVGTGLAGAALANRRRRKAANQPQA